MLQLGLGSAAVSTALAAVYVTVTLAPTPAVNTLEGTEYKRLLHSFEIFLHIQILQLGVQFGLQLKSTYKEQFHLESYIGKNSNPNSLL